MNPQTHVYKLVDEDGNRRVVHCNLILGISFLPVISMDGQVNVSSSEYELVDVDTSNASIQEDSADWTDEESTENSGMMESLM